MLRRAASVYLDIQDYELKAGIRSQEDPALGSVVGQIFLCDTLENGAGYATHLGEPAISEHLLQMIVQPDARPVSTTGWSIRRTLACATLLPDCLRSYSNLAYHNLLDWRLAIDMANPSARAARRPVGDVAAAATCGRSRRRHTRRSPASLPSHHTCRAARGSPMTEAIVVTILCG